MWTLTDVSGRWVEGGGGGEKQQQQQTNKTPPRCVLILDDVEMFIKLFGLNGIKTDTAYTDMDIFVQTWI